MGINIFSSPFLMKYRKNRICHQDMDINKEYFLFSMKSHLYIIDETINQLILSKKFKYLAKVNFFIVLVKKERKNTRMIKDNFYSMLTNPIN